MVSPGRSIIFSRPPLGRTRTTNEPLGALMNVGPNVDVATAQIAPPGTASTDTNPKYSSRDPIDENNASLRYSTKIPFPAKCPTLLRVTSHIELSMPIASPDG